MTHLGLFGLAGGALLISGLHHITATTHVYWHNLFQVLYHNRHLVKLGGRFRNGRQSDLSMQGYNGSFLFNTLDAYGITQAGLSNGLTPAEIRRAGGGASQFTLLTGNPLAEVRQTDAGLFFQDDWRIHPRLTVTAGLRYEVQTNIGDRRNVAPRVGLAWAPGKGTNAADSDSPTQTAHQQVPAG